MGKEYAKTIREFSLSISAENLCAPDGAPHIDAACPQVQFFPMPLSHTPLRSLMITSVKSLGLGAILLAASGAPLALHAEASSPADWENAAVFRRNKELPHAPKLPFPTERAALSALTILRLAEGRP